MHSPFTGAPSITSYLVTVSVSVEEELPKAIKQQAKRLVSKVFHSAALTCTSGFSAYYSDFHVLDFDPNEVKVDLAEHTVFQLNRANMLIIQKDAYRFLTWYFDLLYSNSMCKHSSIPTYRTV